MWKKNSSNLGAPKSAKQRILQTSLIISHSVMLFSLRGLVHVKCHVFRGVIKIKRDIVQMEVSSGIVLSLSLVVKLNTVPAA